MPRIRTFSAIPILLLLLLLLLCAAVRADHLDDLRNWQREGLCVAAEWSAHHAADSFHFGWHAAQAQAGRRLIPSLIFPSSTAGATSAAQKRIGIYADAVRFVSESGLPIIIRGNNLGQSLSDEHWRRPKVAESLAASPLIWWMKNGALEDSNVPDLLGPAENWTTEGERIGGLGYLQWIRKAFPNPATVTITDNNEAYTEEIRRYTTVVGRPRQKHRAWKTLAELEGLSLRMRDRVELLGADSDPFAEWPAFYARRAERYRNYLRGFQSVTWPDTPISLVAYSCEVEPNVPAATQAIVGPAPQLTSFDAGGPSLYIGNYLTHDLTQPDHYNRVEDYIPAWEFARQQRPQAFRQLYFWVTGSRALKAWREGKHAPISPAMFRAYIAWQLWHARAPGVAVLAHHWVGHSTPVSKRMFPNGVDGHPDLSAVTEGDYAIQAALACDEILGTPEIREFWLKGTRVPQPAPRQPQQVWCEAVSLDGRTLVYLFSPCALEGPVTVDVPGTGPVEFPEPPQPAAYWNLPAPLRKVPVVPE